MHQPGEQGQGQQPPAVIMNIIGGSYQLSQETGVLSLVVNPRTAHGFIVVEFLDDNNQYTSFEAHLGHKLSDGNFDVSKCGIHVLPSPIAKLQKVDRSFYYRSWAVTKNDIERYIKPKIEADQQRCDSVQGQNYTQFVTLEGGWPGIVGEVFDLFSLKHLKESAIKSLHDSTSGSASIQISKESVVASLDNSVDKSNCLEWAIATACAIPFIRLSMNHGFFQKYVLLTPKKAIPAPDQGPEELDGPGGTRNVFGSCQIM
jgi:hypothetical protein